MSEYVQTATNGRKYIVNCCERCGKITEGIHTCTPNLVIERLTAEIAIERRLSFRTQLAEMDAELVKTRDLAEHWMILAEQRRVELEECRKLQDLSYMDGLVMRMTYRNGDKVFNVQRVNTLAQLERVSLGAKFIVEVNANDMWQDLLAAMEAKP